MKKILLLALISTMFIACVDKKEQNQEEILIEEVDSTTLEGEALEIEVEETQTENAEVIE